MLNNRALASVILIEFLVVLGMVLPKWRVIEFPPLGSVACSLFNGAVLRVFGLFVVWVALWVWLAWLLGMWHMELLKDTVVIVVGVGFPLLFKTIEAK